jgi:hypothetical protein
MRYNIYFDSETPRKLSSARDISDDKPAVSPEKL